MVPANDLRIGNYVIKQQGNRIEEIQIDANELYRISVKGGYDITGIPITEKALFSLGADRANSKNVYILSNYNAAYFFVTITSNSICLQWDDILDLHLHSTYTIHQLQNLVHALTGEELTKVLTQYINCKTWCML